LKGKPFPYPVVLGSDAEIGDVYFINVYPTFVLIGRDAEVTGYLSGFPGEQAFWKFIDRGLAVTTTKQ
jgi:hypothetical protein